MGFTECMENQRSILMEGALGERLKREYGLKFDEHIAMAGLVRTRKGAEALRNIWNEYIQTARNHHLPFLAATPTRRANKERVAQAGCDTSIIADNVNFLRAIQKENSIEMYVGGLMGCKGDAYTGEGALAEQEAREFHQWQAELFADAKADFLMAGIMPVLSEAAGMARAMAETGLPYIISFTILKNGRLIDGTTIHDAICCIDAAAPVKPVCYMTNCVHPDILYEALSQPFNDSGIVRSRFLGIQANTSPLSYEELDASADLKCSEPEEFGRRMVRLREVSAIKVYGGCCGTDNRHMEQVARRIAK